MDKRSMNRREFLLVAGGAVAVIPLAAALSRCGGGGGGAAAPAAGGDFTVTSTPDNTGHQHAITVRAADLAAGVQVTYTSTATGSTIHTHTVTLTPAQINDINGGKTDSISSSIDLGHAHDFPVKKP